MDSVKVTVLEGERPRLTAIATRMLGSTGEAEDIVQNAWLKLASSEDVEDPPAWLTTVVTRLCIDSLRKRGTRARAEEEIAQGTSVEVAGPETSSLMVDDLSQAMGVVMDSLAPAERAAFVLHDVFSYPFDAIAATLGRSETATRQLASRARRKVSGTPESAKETATREQNRQVVEAFLHAAKGGDLAKLMSLLAPDAYMHVDATGQKMGVPPAFEGAQAVAERFNGAQGAAPVTIDGELAAAWIAGTSMRVAFLFHVEDGLVSEVELIADREVLATFDTVPIAE